MLMLGSGCCVIIAGSWEGGLPSGAGLEGPSVAPGTTIGAGALGRDGCFVRLHESAAAASDVGTGTRWRAGHGACARSPLLSPSSPHCFSLFLPLRADGALARSDCQVQAYRKHLQATPSLRIQALRGSLCGFPSTAPAFAFSHYCCEFHGAPTATPAQEPVE